LRILITVPTFPPYNSGLGNAVANQARMLSARGAEVIVCTGGDTRDSGRSTSGFSVERFAVSGADWLGSPIRGDAGGYIGFLRAARADLVLLNAWQTWSSDLVLRNLASIPGHKAMYSHGLATTILIAPQPIRSLVRYLLWRPYHWRLRRVLRSLDALIALAPSGCDARFDDVRLASRIGVPLYVIPNALPDYALVGMDKPTARLQRKTLIAVGAYEDAKGHDFVLRAYAASSAKNRIPLQIFGQRETALNGQLRRLAGSLGIDDRFLTLNVGVSGRALFDEYRHAIAFLSGSHTECQPLVLLDALASGTPYVARASGCIPGIAGGLSVRTEREAAAALDSLFDQEQWQALSDSGLRAARDVFHPAKVDASLWSVVGKIVGGEGAK
jgi:glycosyltransferase involved in cell wall biosynthesis